MTPISQRKKTMTVAGIELTVHICDDGQKVIEKEGMDKLLALMASGKLSVADAKHASKTLKGLFAT